MSRDDKARRELYPLIAEAIEKGYADIGCGFDISVAQAITPNIYNALMREGYHRSSDVAREIFEEIDELLMPFGYQLKTISLQKYIKLKKKYTEDEG